VATGLGLPAPSPSETLNDEVEASAALSQIGQTWPADGRMVAIVVDPDAGLDGVQDVRRELFSAGLVPLVVAPHGGMLEGDIAAQRTFATARSVEFDAVLLAGCPAPAPDALPARDAKAGAASSATVDPRVVLLLEEAYRHAKAIGAWGAGTEALRGAGYSVDEVGVVTGDDATAVLENVLGLLGTHRVWERFPAKVSV
jgi:catalase